MAEKSIKVRWNDALNDAENALDTLIEIQGECQVKFDNMSETAQDSEKGEALSAITDLDLQGAMDTIQEAQGLDMP